MLNELKKVSKHTLIYGTGVIIGKAIGFFLIPVYTRHLSPAEYGILEMLDLTGFIIGYLFGLGLNQSILKYHNTAHDDAERNEVISTALIFTNFLGLFFLAALLFSSSTISIYVIGSDAYSYYFKILFINLYLGTSLVMVKSVLMAKQKSVLFTAVSFIQTIIAVTLNIVFVVFSGMGVAGILYSTLLTLLGLNLALNVYVLRSSGAKVEFSRLGGMLSYGVPFVPAGIMAFVLNWSDRYILNMYSDLESVGLYALGYKIGMILVFLVAGPFNSIWTSYVFEIQKKPEANGIYSLFATYFLAVICTIGLFISVFSEEIIRLIAHPSYYEAHKVIPLIVLSMIFMCSDNVFKVGLLIRGRSAFLFFSNSVAAAVNIALNFVLIKRYGMMGAALATAISFFIYSYAILYAAQNVYYIGFEYRRLLKLSAAAVAAFAMSRTVAVESVWVSVAMKSLAMAIFPLTLYLTGFLTEQENNFLKQRLRTALGLPA